ncbi:hypothetical protein KIM372_16840 [Bombiscardovia nodaiensis]|uniref:TadE-like domain-containing protein n=1 Tax=Bombiscardovia nodaiensis TaxID=2932181 RepID=A0ABM8BA85_9BIFI|nr:hypothetical protein KIM372_16840 [Bombiscardovia nodaiensis]
MAFAWPAQGKSDCGSVTAEFAVILPAVVAVAALLLVLTQTVTVSLNCQDAARYAAREVVVNQGGGDPAAVAKKVAGPKAEVTLQRANQSVSVVVSCPVVAGPFGVLPPHVSGSAVGMLNE